MSVSILVLPIFATRSNNIKQSFGGVYKQKYIYKYIYIYMQIYKYTYAYIYIYTYPQNTTVETKLSKWQLHTLTTGTIHLEKVQQLCKL